LIKRGSVEFCCGKLLASLVHVEGELTQVPFSHSDLEAKL